MIQTAKIKYPIFRYQTTRGEAVKLKVDINGEERDAISYEKSFPIGLFAKGGPLNNGYVNVEISNDLNDFNGTLYEVISWNNQHDAIKTLVIIELLNKNSEILLEDIPKIEEFNTSEIEIQDMHNKRQKLERLINENNNDENNLDNIFDDEDLFGKEDFK